MKVTITARHFTATEKLKEYSETEVARLHKLDNSLQDCQITYDYDHSNNKTVEVHVHLPGDVFHAKETSDDFYKSLDQAVQKLEKQVLKHKDKLKRRH
jgi:putative sigma-54 modulation protein